MGRHENSPGIPLPRGWPRRVKSAMLNVIALAQYAAAYTRNWAINGRCPGPAILALRVVAHAQRKRTPAPLARVLATVNVRAVKLDGTLT